MILAMSSSSTLAAQLRELAIDWLDSSPRRPTTLRAYRVEVDRLLMWVGTYECGDLPQLTGDFLCRFLTCLASPEKVLYVRTGVRKPLRPSSVTQCRRILSALFLWGAEQGRVPLAVASQARRWSGSRHISQGSGRTMARRAAFTQGAPAATLSESALRREFVCGLAYWCGARPADISTLRRADISISDKLLEVALPDGSGHQVRSYGPPAMAACWRELKRASEDSAFAVLRLGSDHPLSASSITRILAQTTRASGPTNSRDLRYAGTRNLRDAGWTETEIRRQYRRVALSIDEPTPTMAAMRRRVRALEGSIAH